MHPDEDLSHPAWLKAALENPKRIWNTWPLLNEREELRREASARSRDFFDVRDREINPFSVWTGALEDNRRKNRFGVEAYERNRVVVGDPERYVNANYVREGAGGRWWIAAEAPSSHSVHAFLSLFLPPDDDTQNTPRVHTIVQLSQPDEGSSHPSDPYFPPTLSHAWTIHAERGSTLPPLQVQTIKQKRMASAHCTKTTFSISRPTKRSQMRESETFEVVHLLFESWPAKSIPNTDGAHALINLIQLLHPLNTRPQQHPQTPPGSRSRHSDPPILVHCSEGGRTGTFIAINSLLRTHKCIPSPYDDTHTAPHIPPSPLGTLPSELAVDPVLREIEHIRDQRAGMVDNDNQVRFIYQVLWDGISERDWSQGVGRFAPIPPDPPGSALVLTRTNTRSSHRKAKLSVENVWSAIRGRS